MLTKIKSIKILKNIFSFLKENIKLKIIIYNKALQDKLNISSEKYKKESNKILLIEENGFGKIMHQTNKFVFFEGKFENGNKNGKGKEYQIILTELKKKNTKIIISNEKEINEYFRKYVFKEGCKRDKIDYKGKEFNFEIKLKFEGEYLNGKRNGKGTEYGYIDNILFEGEYLDGKRWNGNGIEFDKKKLKIFNCRYKNGKKISGKIYSNSGERRIEYEFNNGKVKEYDSMGNIIFEGEYYDGKRWNGIEKLYGLNGKLVFKSRLKNGEMNGKRKEYDILGNLVFEGEYINGKIWNGKGIRLYENLNKKFYIEYINGKKSGITKEYNIKINYYFKVNILKVINLEKNIMKKEF